MDLEFTSEQEELRQSVRAVLERECPVSLCRQVVETGEPADDLWRTMAKLDWLALSVPEGAGGMGLGLAEVAVVVEELGRRLAPGPYLATMTQFVPALCLAGNPEQQERYLSPVVAGDSGGALALSDHGRWAPGDALSSTARRTGSGWELAGTKHAVLARPGDALVVAAATPAGPGLFVVDGAVAVSTAVRALDRSRPLLSVSLDGVVVGPDDVLGEPGSDTVVDALTRAVEIASLGVALEVLGATEALLDLVVQYVKDRHQFGVPIGKFQAVKHKMADDYVAVQRARALAYFAVAAVEEDDPRRAMAVHMAKIAADDCQRLVCQDAFQSFGGIGFTWEHDAHLYIKRAKTASALFGGAADRRLAVAGLLAATT